MDGRERHQRLMALFDEAVELATDARGRLLEKVRAEDGKLADELKAMLKFDDTADVDPLDVTNEGAVAAFALSMALAKERALPETIGQYKIIRKLGEGGMGMVLEAEQMRPKRRVALKVLRAELATDRMRRRFAAEAEILARMTHPGIAQVYEAVVDVPEPYVVMELVDGTTIDEHIERHKLGLRAVVDLLAQVGDAVDHAHKNGIVHRDLKPQNILVTADHRSKVLDFGIARVLDAETQPGHTMTREGEILGTPAYMSPEQTQLEPGIIGPRTDVYALGVIAYVLLTGDYPYPVSRTDLIKTFIHIRDTVPPPMGKVRRELGGDLDRIVQTALAKAPERRYPSAAAWSEDLRRWLAHEPIRARPPSAWYQLARFAQRNRLLVASIIVAFVLLVAGVITTTILLVAGARTQAELVQRLDEMLLLQARATVAEDPTKAVEWLADLSSGAAWDRAWAIGYDAVGRGVSSRVLGGHRADVEWIDARGPWIASASFDGTARLWGDGSEHLLVPPGEHEELNRVALSPDGAHVAVGGREGTVTVWRTDGSLVWSEDLHDGESEHIVWAPDGRSLVSVGDGRLQKVGLDGKVQTLADDRVPSGDVAWSADGRLLAVALESGRIRIIAPDGTGGQMMSGHDAAVDSVLFSPDGRWLVSAADNGEVWAWDLVGGEPKTLCPADVPTKGMVFVDDGRVAVVDRAGRLRLFTVATGAVEVLTSAGAVYRGVAVSPDGRWLATASDDRTGRVWDLHGGEPLILRGHRGPVLHTVFTSDSRTVVTSSEDGDVRTWPLPTAGRSRWEDLGGWPRAAAGREGRVVVVDDDKRVRLLDVGAGVMRTLQGKADVHDAAWSPDGRWFATAQRDGVVEVWDAATGVVAKTHTIDEKPVRVAFSRDGKWLATGAEAQVILWDPNDREVRLQGHADRVLALTFTHEPEVVYSAARDGTVRRWVIDGAHQDLAKLDGAASHLVASPDGRTVAASSRGGEVVWWRAGTRADARHGSPIASLAASDEAVAAGDHDGLIEVLGARATTLRGHVGSVTALAFGPGVLVSGGDDRSVRVWDLASGQGHVIEAFEGPVVGLAVVAGHVVTVADEPVLQVWPLAIPSTESEVRSWLAGLTH